MAGQVRTALALEAAAFWAAALVHSGWIVRSHAHSKAATAEAVIGAVLLGAVAVSALRARATRAAALGAQTFALVGTLVGILTIAVGVGPRSTLDLFFHAGFVAALVTGLVLVARGKLGASSRGS